MKTLYALMALLLVSAAIRAQSTVDSVEIKFQKLLDQTGMTFKMPEGSVKIPIVKNMQIHYDYAVSYPSRNMEIRYTIVPMGKRVAEYQEFQKKHDPGSSMADPNKMFEISAIVTATNMGGGTQDTTIKGRKFPTTDVKNEFGADIGGFLMVQVKNNSAGTNYKFCSMVALQKDNVANVYIFFLCNSMQEFVQNLKDLGPLGIYYALRFKPDETPLQR
ncbi:hypothetical protein [Mucilaginibacter sp. dw_454]|uniref:hypothetical protein n=1 Tax=Mucilaginibacter sp. dw_454 TaxID=2720079 RepID=UPI001BD20393|nr:hypothetical protein [Mucilaginibacter sp. dw_454]